RSSFPSPWTTSSRPGKCGPEAIAPHFPGLELVVHGDGIEDLVVLDLLPDPLEVLFAFALGRVDANDEQVLIGEVLVPARVPRVIADAVDSAERPEVEDDDFALLFFEEQELAVDPGVDAAEFGGGDAQ